MWIFSCFLPPSKLIQRNLSAGHRIFRKKIRMPAPDAGIRQNTVHSHSYAGITRIRFEGQRRLYAASQPACASTPWICEADLCTAAANLSGLPAISVSSAVWEKGHPVGIQLMSGAFMDGELLNLAYQLEKAVQAK